MFKALREPEFRGGTGFPPRTGDIRTVPRLFPFNEEAIKDPPDPTTRATNATFK